MAKISVILPTFNAESTIDRCIESILSQTYTDWELICCDDCSDDGTYKKLCEWEKKDNRIKVIKNKKNMKVSYTRNKCIDIANGKYIAQIDDDDYCHPTRFMKQINFLEMNKEYSFVGSNMYIFDENNVYGEKIVKEYPEANDFLWNSMFSNPSVMFKKEALDSVEGYRVAKETRRGQDYDLYMRLYAKGFKGYNIQESLTYYYRGRNSYSKCKYIYRLDEAKIRYKNFKKLGLLPKGFIYVLKPLIIGLIPMKILEDIKNKMKYFVKGEKDISDVNS